MRDLRRRRKKWHKSLDNVAAELPDSITGLCDQLAESIYIFDSRGIIRYANRAFEELTGFSRAEVVGESSVTLKSDAKPEAVFAEMWDQLRARESFRFVSSNRRKDGSTYDESVMISPIHDARTGNDFCVHIGRSIGLSRMSFEVFAIHADSAPARILLQREGLIYFVNGRLSTLPSRTEADLIGKKWLDLVAEPDRTRALEYDAENSQKADTTSLECRLITPEGDRWVMADFQSLQLSGDETVSDEFTAAYIVDITERELAEERLSHAVSLQSATLESTTDGIVVLNRARERVGSNRRYADMWNIGDIDAKNSDEIRALLFEQVKDAEALGRVMDQT